MHAVYTVSENHIKCKAVSTKLTWLDIKDPLSQKHSDLYFWVTTMKTHVWTLIHCCQHIPLNPTNYPSRDESLISNPCKVLWLLQYGCDNIVMTDRQTDGQKPGKVLKIPPGLLCRCRQDRMLPWQHTHTHTQMHAVCDILIYVVTGKRAHWWYSRGPQRVRRKKSTNFTAETDFISCITSGICFQSY